MFLFNIRIIYDRYSGIVMVVYYLKDYEKKEILKFIDWNNVVLGMFIKFVIW